MRGKLYAATRQLRRVCSRSSCSFYSWPSTKLSQRRLTTAYNSLANWRN